jgi:hypothetical protein
MELWKLGEIERTGRGNWCLGTGSGVNDPMEHASKQRRRIVEASSKLSLRPRMMAEIVSIAISPVSR